MWVLLEQIQTPARKQAQNSYHHHTPGTSAWIHVSQNFLCEFFGAVHCFSAVEMFTPNSIPGAVHTPTYS